MRIFITVSNVINFIINKINKRKMMRVTLALAMIGTVVLGNTVLTGLGKNLAEYNKGFCLAFQDN